MDTGDQTEIFSFSHIYVKNDDVRYFAYSLYACSRSFAMVFPVSTVQCLHEEELKV